jgi:rhamnopyranosyl-N-acetylglucosaminyl-diphospho-decaprenol beta-1,3/1,4-galactofuranosyltransferase
MDVIAVCIVTHNRKNDLLIGLNSLYKQSYRNFDVFIWDNCSRDDTEATIKTAFPSIDYIYSSKNIGGSGGYASLLKLCFEKKYSLFWCLDDDAVLEENCLSELTNAYTELNKNCIIGAKIISDTNSKFDFWPLQGAYNSNTKRIHQFNAEEINQINSGKRNIYPTASVALLGLFTNYETLSLVGFPKENFFISSDDVEFCLRAWKKGIPVYKIFNAVIIHPPLHIKRVAVFHKKIDIILMSDFKLYYFIRNNIYVGKKYFTTRDFLKLIGMLLITIWTNSLNKNKKPLHTICRGFKSLLIGVNFK